jgi:hypothetical protein
MAKVLVSLVSEQTIPNVLFIREFIGKVDKFLFITTSYMEKNDNNKIDWILNSTNIDESLVERLVVNESIVKETEDLLQKTINPENEYIVNLTGGTKPMSIAVYNAFENYRDNIFYIPIGKNSYIKIFDKVGNFQKDIDYRVNVKEYLNAYGVKFTNKMPISSFSYTEVFFDRFMQNNLDYEVIEKLRLYYRNGDAALDKIINNSNEDKRIPTIKEFLSEIKFPTKDKSKLTKGEIEYLTGGWFEEYIYHKVQIILSLSNDEVLLGVKLQKNQRTLDNDLDVVFTYNNAIHVIECKTGMTEFGKVSTKLFNETVYKASALRKNFGLTVNSYLFTLSSLEKKNSGEVDYFERASVLGIKLIDRNSFLDSSKLDDFIQSLR